MDKLNTIFLKYIGIGEEFLLIKKDDIWSDLIKSILSVENTSLVPISSEKKKEASLIVLFIKSKQLNKNSNLFKSIQEEIRYCYNYIPVITISTEKFLNNDRQEKNDLQLQLNLARSLNFFDSSIWNYYVPIDKEFKNNFSNAINEIKTNYQKGYYNLIVCKEFIDLQYRLLQNSFIEDFGEGHAANISPFIFHSESKMKEESLNIANKIFNNYNSFYWKILLVDDYAEEQLRTINEYNSNSRLTKYDIIKNVIENNSSFSVNNFKRDKINILIENATSLGNAIQKISKSTYDIILLDYLLDKKQNGQREYSHNLLKVIANICSNKEGYKENDYKKLELYCIDRLIDEQKNDEIYNDIISGIIKNKGPLGKFWFLNISSFQSAFLDRLQEQGLGHNCEHWYLSRGGDPVNTPKLFKYTFLRFMELQTNFVIYDTKKIIAFFENRPLGQSGNSCEAGTWARTIFGEFIFKFYSRDIINHDVNNSSGFACSVNDITKKEEKYRKAYNLTDHFRHLLYLLAFDSGLNMQIAWEELQLIKRKLINENTEKIKNTFENIEICIAKVLNEFK